MGQWNNFPIIQREVQSRRGLNKEERVMIKVNPIVAKV